MNPLLTYMFFGFSSVWLGIVAYVLLLGRRQAALELEIQRLRERL